MKLSIAAALLAAFLFPCANAHAQRDDQFAWGIGAGGTITSGLARDSHSNGPHGLIMFGIGAVDSPFGIRFDGMYSALGDRDNTTTSTDQGEATVFSFTGNALFNLYGSNTRIYFVGGIGGFWYNPDGAGTDAVNDFGVNAGLGLWIPRINGFVEGRWFNLYRAMPDPVTGLKGKKSARLYPITLGIMF